MKAVIMAGGEGTRLRPMTITSPKPMLPLGNRPVLEYVIDLLKRHGFDTVILTLHYLADDIISYFGDGSDYGIKIIYSLEDEPLGTAGSIKKIEEYLDETFLVISGDGLTDIDLSKLLEYHRQTNAVSTLTLTRVEKPVEYGVVITGDNGRIERFLEKPSWGEVFSDQVNTGIYVIEPEVLKLMDPGKTYDFSKDIFPQLLDHERGLYGYLASEYWCDMGDLDNFRKSVQDLLNGKVLHELKGSEIRSGLWVGEGTTIDPSATLEGPLLIGSNCRIGADVNLGPYTCLGDNCIIADNCSLHRAILFNNVFLGRRTTATNCIVGKHCTVKSNVTLNDGCVLGDDCHIGRGSSVAAQVKVWPKKHITDGTVVSMDIVWGKLGAGVLFAQNGVLGVGNIEITPEFAMRLGAAYGSILPKGSCMAVSRDPHSVSRLINRALIAGLSSVGVNVQDFRATPVPLTRQIIGSDRKLSGGIHTHIFLDNPRFVEIEFLDGRGVNIDKNLERKIENIFSRQDFRRTDMDEVGTIDYAEDPIARYCEHFMKCVDVEGLKAAHLKVVIDHCYGAASQVLPNLLSRVGVETINLNAYLDQEKALSLHNNREQALKQLGDIVVPLHANFGVLIDFEGESFDVVDETGHVIDGGQLLAMVAYMTFKTIPGAVVAVPINTTRVVDAIAHLCHGSVVRTKTDLRSLMHTAALGQSRLALGGTPSGAFVFPMFSPGVDAFFSVFMLMYMILKSNRSLSNLATQLPAQHALRETVVCDWSVKAKVMRLLVEVYREQLMELMDGVRIRFEAGIALVLPHPAMASLRIWVDGDSDEAARDIMNQLKTTIKELSAVDEEDSRLGRVTTQVHGSQAVLLPEERAFHFWTPGRYLGIQARSLRSFKDVLHFVDVASLEYHAKRRDFSLWIAAELGMSRCATLISQFETRLKGAELRQKLLNILEDDASKELPPDE